MTKIEQIIERLDNLTPKLYDLGNRLYSKFGTESYEERCINFDARDELLKIIELLKIEQELSSLKAEAESAIECTTCGRKFSDEQEWDIHCEIGKCKEAEKEVSKCEHIKTHTVDIKCLVCSDCGCIVETDV